MREPVRGGRTGTRTAQEPLIGFGSATPLLVIEGVETPDGVRIARDAGAQWNQGYYLNVPECAGFRPG